MRREYRLTIPTAEQADAIMRRAGMQNKKLRDLVILTQNGVIGRISPEDLKEKWRPVDNQELGEPGRYRYDH